MIHLTRIDGSPVTINADEIEIVEGSHDTMVSLRSGKRVIVSESPETIVELVIDYRRQCNLLPKEPKIL